MDEEQYNQQIWSSHWWLTQSLFHLLMTLHDHSELDCLTQQGQVYALLNMLVMILVQIKATYPDGSPVEATAIKITTSINNNKDILFDGEMMTNESGIAEMAVSVPRETNCLQIKVSCLTCSIQLDLISNYRLKQQKNFHLVKK